jgi:hypothetical protein
MTPLEIALLFAVAALVYQEIAWRDRTRRLEADYEKRIATEVALAYERGQPDDEGQIRSFTFHAEKEEPHGLFREAVRQLFIAVTMDGDTVKHAAGDLAEIDRFQIPPRIRKALVDFMEQAPRVAVQAGGR